MNRYMLGWYVAAALQASDTHTVVVQDKVRAKELVEFLCTRAHAWESNFPQTVSWREWDENSIGAVRWCGFRQGEKLYVDMQIYEDGVTRAQAEKGLAGHRGTLIFSGVRWLLVERPIPDEPARPWSGVESDNCPSAQWASSMMAGMWSPVLRRPVSEYVKQTPSMVIREGESAIEIDFAATEDVARHFESKQYSWVKGFLGLNILFSRDADWRPTIIRECFSPEQAPDSPESKDIERTSFGGADAVVLRSYKWYDWASLGEIRIPRQFVYDFRVRAEVEGLRVLRSIKHSELEAEVLAALPDGVSFALAPPASMGLVGRISNITTGEVRLYDGRSTAEQLDAREQNVLRLTRTGDKQLNEPRWRPSIGWWRTGLLTLGAALVGVAAARLVLTRRKQGA